MPPITISRSAHCAVLAHRFRPTDDDRRLLFLWKLLWAQKLTASRSQSVGDPKPKLTSFGQVSLPPPSSRSPSFSPSFVPSFLPSFLSVGDISVPHHNFSPLRNPRGQTDRQTPRRSKVKCGNSYVGIRHFLGNCIVVKSMKCGSIERENR